MIAMILAASTSFDLNSSIGYLSGALIALFILGYLLYSFFKPENF
jgi:K+-transporting ATPase KdpF subunit